MERSGRRLVFFVTNQLYILIKAIHFECIQIKCSLLLLWSHKEKTVLRNASVKCKKNNPSKKTSARRGLLATSLRGSDYRY